MYSFCLLFLYLCVCQNLRRLHLNCIVYVLWDDEIVAMNHLSKNGQKRKIVFFKGHQTVFLKSKSQRYMYKYNLMLDHLGVYLLPCTCLRDNILNV